MNIESVPLLDLKAQYHSIKHDLDAAMMRVVESQTFILGPEVEGLEREVAEYCQTPFAVGVSSGTDALLIALMALDIGPGDEVITTPYTFFATVGSISRLGARAVFVDVDPHTYNLDPSQLAGAVSEKTRAIMPVHLFGQAVDMDPLTKFAAAKGLPIIEDAAQAIGTEYHGRRAGSLGTMGCFSFFPSKNLGAFGDAGLVTVADEKLYHRLLRLRVHGGVRRYYHEEVGGNFRIDALQAAILRVKLRSLEAWTLRRRENACWYHELFTEAGLVGRDSSPIELPFDAGLGRHVYNQFSILAERRDALQAFLTERSVGTAIYYPLPLHLQECFAPLGYREGAFPVAERLASRSLALPIYPELTRDHLRFVVAQVAEFYAQKK